MNILSTEEMRQKEAALAQIPITPAYRLKVPSERQFLTIATFQGSVFPEASGSAQKAVQKMLSLAENMRSLPKSQANSLFHMLTLTLINILYQDKFRSSTDDDFNNYLLETIKCSLYSPDLDFNLIRHVDFPLHPTQLKLLVLQFFEFMAQQSLSIKTHRINCAAWIFQHNPLLLPALTLFLRLILSKIGVQEASDYKKCVDSEEAIMNLIEYFDLHYRSCGEVILFYEDGIFLSVQEKEIVVGEYYENEGQKVTQKQQLQIKSSVKLNMIESFLVNANEKSSMIAPKKKGIVDSDLKLFNFMLENSSEDENEHPPPRDRDADIETPSFKGSVDQFHFLRKKKTNQFKPEDVRNEFQRLIMDQSQEFIEDEDVAPTPYLGGEHQFNFAVNFANKQLSCTQQIDSPIDQLNHVENPKVSAKQSLKHPFEGGHVLQPNLLRHTHESISRNSFANGFASVNPKKEMVISTFTDTGNVVGRKERELECWEQIVGCRCRKAKARRNVVTSKVVEVQLVGKGSYLSNVTSPKFLSSYKPTYERKGKAEQYLSKHRAREANKKEDKAYLDRKPAFLKNLKKNKPEPQAEQDFSKSVVNESKRYEEGISKQTSHERLRYGKFNLCLDEVEDNQYSRSMPKKYEHKSSKTVSDLGEKEAGNEKLESMATYRSGVSKPWQTNSNFIQKVPEYSQMGKIKSSQMSNPNTLSTSPLKFFAPVQIIAPTVYLNSNTPSPNNIVFKLDDGKAKTPNPEAKPAYQDIKTQRMVKGSSGQSQVRLHPAPKNDREIAQYKPHF